MYRTRCDHGRYATTDLPHVPSQCPRRSCDAVRERWDSAAALIDLHAFEPSFRQQVSFSRAQLPQPDPTIEELMARDSTMPRAVAEWQIAQMKRARAGREFGDYTYEFAGITTQHALLTMTVPAAAARWLAA